MIRNAAAAALLLTLGAACSRPPEGMTRLDSGSSNHAFQVDHEKKFAYYVEGGGSFVTKLDVLDLETGKRGSYQMPHQKIRGLMPTIPGAATISTEGTGVDNRGEERLLVVDGASGRVMDQEVRTRIEPKDLLGFPRLAPKKDEFDLISAAQGDPKPGVAVKFLHGKAREYRFFPTPTEPSQITSDHRGLLYATYETLDGNWSLEQLNPMSGARRAIAVFPRRVESMAAAGVGLVAIRQADDGKGPRRFAMVNAESARVELELPWSDEESRIVAVNEPKRLLYVSMSEGDNETFWAIHFDEPALRAASGWLNRNRGSSVRKLIGEDVLALGLLVGAFVFFGFVMVARQSMD